MLREKQVFIVQPDATFFPDDRPTLIIPGHRGEKGLPAEMMKVRSGRLAESEEDRIPMLVIHGDEIRMNFRLGGVDIALIRDLMDKDVTLFPFLKNHPGRQKLASRLSCSGFQDLMRQGIREKKITFDRDIVLFFETNTKNEVIVNMTRVNGNSPVDPFGLSRAELEGRRQVWELYAFLKERIPGFKHAWVEGKEICVKVRDAGLFPIPREEGRKIGSFHRFFLSCHHGTIITAGRG